jgi:hypothetical protein
LFSSSAASTSSHIHLIFSLYSNSISTQLKLKLKSTQLKFNSTQLNSTQATSTSIKFKCKSWIDTFGQRSSKAAGSLITNQFAASMVDLIKFVQ